VRERRRATQEEEDARLAARRKAEDEELEELRRLEAWEAEERVGLDTVSTTKKFKSAKKQEAKAARRAEAVKLAKRRGAARKSATIAEEDTTSSSEEDSLLSSSEEELEELQSLEFWEAEEQEEQCRRSMKKKSKSAKKEEAGYLRRSHDTKRPCTRLSNATSLEEEQIEYALAALEHAKAVATASAESTHATADYEIARLRGAADAAMSALAEAESFAAHIRTDAVAAAGVAAVDLSASATSIDMSTTSPRSPSFRQGSPRGQSESSDERGNRLFAASVVLLQCAVAADQRMLAGGDRNAAELVETAVLFAQCSSSMQAALSGGELLPQNSHALTSKYEEIRNRIASLRKADPLVVAVLPSALAAFAVLQDVAEAEAEAGTPLTVEAVAAAAHKAARLATKHASAMQVPQTSVRGETTASPEEMSQIATVRQLDGLHISDAPVWRTSLEPTDVSSHTPVRPYLARGLLHYLTTSVC
jgi:hypothetical protein